MAYLCRTLRHVHPRGAFLFVRRIHQSCVVRSYAPASEYDPPAVEDLLYRRKNTPDLEESFSKAKYAKDLNEVPPEQRRPGGFLLYIPLLSPFMILIMKACLWKECRVLRVSKAAVMFALWLTSGGCSGRWRNVQILWIGSGHWIYFVLRFLRVPEKNGRWLLEMCFTAFVNPCDILRRKRSSTVYQRKIQLHTIWIPAAAEVHFVCGVFLFFHDSFSWGMDVLARN